MLPVVPRLFAPEAARMTRHRCVMCHEVDPLRVGTNAHHLPYQFARHRVAIALLDHQAGAGHFAEGLDVAVKWGNHGHQAGLFLFEHFCQSQVELRVLQLAPERPALRQ